MLKSKILLVVAVSLFSVFEISAQTAVTIDEAKTNAVLTENAAEISLAIANSGKSFTGEIFFELLDKDEQIRAKTSKRTKIKRGASTDKISLPLGDLMRTAQDEIGWFRLRYSLKNKNGNPQTSGIVSLSEIIKDIFELRVTAAENVFAGMNYQVRARAVHPITNAPVRDVKIAGEISLDVDTDAEENKLELTAEAITDADGFANFAFTIPADTKLDYDGDLKVSGSKYGIVREVEQDLNVAGDNTTVFINTDKPIYQPGQNLNVRGLLLNGAVGEKKTVGDAEIEFSVSDGDDTLLYKETLKTSEFGIAAISWAIPENAKLGEYYIRVKDEDGENIGYENFKVSRYDLPNFTVETKSDRDFYLAKDQAANVIVKAGYLFGKPVARGKVRIVEESERRWNYREQKWETDEGQVFEGETDADGNFTAKIDLKKSHGELEAKSWRRYQDVHFAAYFTDLTTNRTEQRRFDLRLSKEPIHIYFVGNTYNNNPNLPLTFYVSTFYADGSPANCNVKVIGKYENETAEKPIAELKTNRYGAGKLRFNAAPNDDIEKDLELKFTASDEKGNAGTHDEEIDFDADDKINISFGKTIFHDGETVKAEIVSNRKSGLVYLDVVKDWSVLESHYVYLKNGRARLEIPYKNYFKGELTIAAYTESVDDDGDLDLIKTSRGIIFPAPNNLRLYAKFSNSVYRPNEEVTINFSVFAPDKSPIETALGIVVFDKAIEERARTDAEFGNYRGMFYGYRGLLGDDESFGGLTKNDLNELDLRQPISDEIQLAAEIMLYNNFYYPEISRSDDYAQARNIFAETIDKQLAPVETALKNAYADDFSHPTDDASLRKILNAKNIDFDKFSDPWLTNYRAEFEVDETNDLLTIESAGADKKFDTPDDFTVLKISFAYFLPIGKKNDTAVADYHKRTGEFIRSYDVLKEELNKQGVDLENLKDRWNKDYKIEFGESGRDYTIVFHSGGADGIYTANRYGNDDFDVWTSRIDYFAEKENIFRKILNEYVRKKNVFPKTAEEFKKLLAENESDLTEIKDGFGREVYLTATIYERYADKVNIKNETEDGSEKILKTTITPVTEQIVTLKIRSRGADFVEGTADDFDLAVFSGVISEQSADDEKPNAEIKIVPTTGATGAIRGTLTDPNGAVIPGASVTATNNETEETNSVNSDSEGVYLLENLVAGKHQIRAEASGFTTNVFSDIPVFARKITELNINFYPSEGEVTVTVSAGVETIETASIQFGYGNGSGSGFGSGNGNGIGDGDGEKDVAGSQIEKATPRLRQYFPETLVWNPELITDKNGTASLKFRLADSITTWKMYAIASDKTGKIGVAEKEIKAFQPFFADLEPPKFLTVGDEIFLPVQIRNYTEKQQKVDVSMADGDWFSFLGADKKQIEVPANDAENAVFGFRADEFIKDGKQKVTAFAETDSDAIEKSVEVKPNGREIVETESKLFENAARFDVNFPANTLPKTQTAEVKIYSNLLAHVAESVEGLLQRPYGCGEQTISSTYPNLMILKFSKNENKLRQTARKYLQKGYEKLLGYQVANGGFSYWGGNDEADIALTAYALRFLSDADEFVEVDENVIKRAEKWLLSGQQADGSFTKKYRWETSEDANRTKILTSYVARTLAMLKAKKDDEPETASDAVLQKSLDYLRKRNTETSEPYALALFGLASLDAGNTEEARAVAAKLEKMAISEGDAVYWNLETNTPFYGWGTAGRIETTALVVNLLTKISRKDAKEQRAQSENFISKGVMFLLKNKDRYGVWYSTQTTINVLDAFLATLQNNERQTNQTVQIFLNGENLKNINVATDEIAPIVLDLDEKLNQTQNLVEIKTTGNSSVMSQIVQTHYVDWQTSQTEQAANKQIRLDYLCDKQTSRIMDDVNCSVEAERIGFEGYGMLLAEIGLPPGADVSRESLQTALENDWSFSRYDVLPDRIIVYMWAKAGGTKFNFKFKPRYAINAQTPASVVYDYYNSEAKTTVAPMKFTVSD